MEKRIYDKKTGIHYELQGDYYLPCLELPKQPKVEIGIWGKRHLRYIKQYHKIRYTTLLTSLATSIPPLEIMRVGVPVAKSKR